MLIASEHVVTGPTPEVAPRTVEIQDGRVTTVREGIAEGAELVSDWIIPGYVDVHSHGAAGFDFGDPDLDGVQTAIDFMRAHGTTTQFASLVTAPLDTMVEQIGRIRAFIEAGELAGVHLEGPFLAAARKGAHDITLLRDPTPENVATVVQACQGLPSQITLAVERAGGLEAARALVQGGVVVAFGHSDGDAEITKAAVDAGASNATHLFNAMRSIHHREPGPIPILLDDDRVMIELICDGIHMSLDVAEMAIRAAGWQRVALMTDSMAANGKPDGDYVLGSLKVVVNQGVARLATDDGTPGAIAGSTLTMDVAVENMVAQGLPLPEVAMMAATTPARWFGLDEVGQLAPGRFADLCLVTPDGALQRVMRRGTWVK